LLSNGPRNAIAMSLPTSVPSTISDGNLVILRRDLDAGANLTVTFARVLGIYV